MRLSSVVLTIATTLLCTAPSWAENVGQATRVQRFAYQTPPQAQKSPIFRMNPIVKNARLETVPSGALEVTFTDGSRLTLGASSAIVVDNYVYAGPQGAGQQTLKMTRGLFRFVSGAMPKDQVKLQTPSVTIGIRGTVVKANVRNDGSSVIFFEHGQGNVQNAAGQNVQMTEGDMVEVGADGSIGNPKHQNWSAGDVAVDQGLNPFNQSFGGTDGGSGGGDGAGSSGGSRGNDQ